MFREFLRFELRYQLRSPLPWLIALLLSFLAFLAMTGDNVTIGEPIGNVNRNAPFVIMQFLLNGCMAFGNLSDIASK